MRVTINGEIEVLNEGIALAQLIKDRGFVPERVIVEYNFKIAPREAWEKIILQENDRLEILTFMGGG